MTPSQKKLIKYLSDPKKYWVEPVKYGCLFYYDIHEAKMGVIDRLQGRVIERAIELKLITHDQLSKSRQL